jgi:glycosyltransferase involved in cell wall biosynthesis
MKIVYFYQYFSTPKGSWGTRVYEFCKNWVEAGHDVTVVSSIYSKSDLTATKFVEDQVFDGIKVKVLNIRIDNKQTKGKRIWTWIQFMLMCCWYALRLPADVVIASSGPITVGVPGLVAKKLRRRKFIFEARDLWPQTAIEMGQLNSERLKKYAYKLERALYRNADLIVALSPGMVAEIQNKMPVKSIIDVTNAANIPLFSTPSSFDIGEWKNKIYGIYTGNIGAVNNSVWLLEAARILKEKGREDIGFLLIGDGQLKEELKEKAKDSGLHNFVIMDLMPKVNMVAYLQNALVSCVPLKNTPVLNTSSPNKFFESLVAGVPIVQNTTGWMKDYLETNKVGFTLDSDDSEALANLLIDLDSNRELVREMSERAKVLGSKDFDKDYLSNKMLTAIEGVL